MGGRDRLTGCTGRFRIPLRFAARLRLTTLPCRSLGSLPLHPRRSGCGRPSPRFLRSLYQERNEAGQSRPTGRPGPTKDHIMSGSLNRVTLIGNLGNDPETRNFQNGGKIVRFNLATNESWTDKQSGERRERVEWHRVAITNPGLATLAADYLRKGSKVLVEGQLRTSRYTDSEGIERYVTEVTLAGYDARLTFLDSKRNEDGQDKPQRGRSPSPAARATASADDLDSDIPF